MLTSVTVALSGPATATLRYTTNGTDPTTASTAYTAPLVFGTTTTLRVKAFRTDYTPSATLTQTYTITTAAPVLSRNSGAYDPGTRVTITTADPGATLRMTLTGVDPTSTDPVVASGSSLLVGAYTLKVRAFKSGALDSAVAVGTYTLTGALVGGDAAAGGSHTLLATPNGLVYGWGDNGYGQLGDSSTTSRSTPRLIQTLTGISRLAAGMTHSVGTTMDGQLYTWGANGYGQLGDGTTNSRSAPYLVSLPSPVTAVAAGYYHTLALTTSGRVYAWGWGTSGQLGLGTSVNVSTPTLISPLTNVVAIAAGQFHSLAVTASGQVYAWGWNANGQVGDGTTSQRLTPTLLAGVTGVTSVAAGGTYSLARTSTGAVYAWGYGPNGELGLGGAMLSRSTPTLIANLSAQAIAAGAGHSAALRTDGSIATWGTNSSGQLGDGTTTARTTPVSASVVASMAVVSVGSAHTVAVRNDGAVFTWGTGASGRLGDGGTANRTTPFNVFAGGGTWGTPTPVLSLPPGIYRTTQTLGVSAPLGATVRYTTNGQPPTETDTVLATGSALPLTATTTLAFRAWLPGLAPSGVAMAEYEFQPLPPTATPAAGTYLSAQTVTLSAASGTTIRYTLDGTTPTASSPAYAAPVTVAAPATLTAAAFQAGWTPSATFTASYVFPSAPPVATPSGGALGPAQPVTLSAAAGSAIHYTLDGSTPSAASMLYAGPFTLGSPTTVRAIAIQPGWAPSAVTTASYTPDTTGPVITTSYEPPPNAEGWHRVPVTVTFACSDAGVGVATCPSPVQFDTDGAEQTMTATATDLAGNPTTATIVVSLDRAPATIALLSPVAETTTTAASTLVSADVTDALSGVTAATCNGIAATVVDGSLQCSVPLATGLNLVAVQALDRAGNNASHAVRIVRTGTPTFLSIVPSRISLGVGDARQMELSSDASPLPTALTWTSSDALVVDVTAAGVVTGVTAGQATVTAVAGTLSTTVLIDVIPAGPWATGTTAWAIAAEPAAALQGLVTAGPTADYTSLVALESSSTTAPVLRGYTSAGTPTYRVTLPRPLGEAATRPMGDQHGGVLVASGGGLTYVNVHPAGANWRYDPPPHWQLGDHAVGPDGTVFAQLVERHAQYPGLARGPSTVVGLDGQTGYVKFEIVMPITTVQRLASSPPCAYEAGQVDLPPVFQVVVDVAGQATWLAVHEAVTEVFDVVGGDCAVVSVSNDAQVTLYRVTPSGGLTTVVLHDYQGASFRVGVHPVLPDGEGGVLASWYCPTAFCATGTRSRHVSRALSVSSEIDAPIVPALSGAGTTAYGVGADGLARAVDMPTGAVQQTFAAAGMPEAVLQDGTVAVGTTTGTTLYDAGAQAIATGLASLASGIVFGETSVSAQANQVVARITRTAALEQSAGRPVAQGNSGGQSAPLPPYDDADHAARALLAVMHPIANSTGWEWGAFVCSSDNVRYYWSRLVTSWLQDRVTLAELADCGAMQKSAHLHTHPVPHELPYPSGRDDENANTDATNMMRYLGTPVIGDAWNSQMLRFRRDLTLPCTPPPEGQLFWVGTGCARFHVERFVSGAWVPYTWQ